MSWVVAAAQLKAVNVRKNNVMVMLTPTTLSSGQLSVLQGFVIFMMDYTISSLTLLFITNVRFMLLIKQIKKVTHCKIQILEVLERTSLLTLKQTEVF